MNAKLEEFLTNKKVEEKNKYEAEKQKTLIELGLYDKEYSPNGESSKEYSLIEWDGQSQKNKYYKKVPIEITDEEYQEVKKYSAKEDATQSNTIATILTVIAWIIFIVGFINGIALATELSFVITLIYWGISFATGTMLLGFAEIIKLLNAIKNK